MKSGSIGSAVKQFFKNWGVDVLLSLVAPFVMLPYEIYKHVGAIKDAAKAVAHAIASFFVGHSPIPQGPLRTLNMSREIAQTIQPWPVIAAMRRVAAVTAIAAPMMIGAGAMPAMASSAAAAGGAAPVVVNLSVSYHVAGGASGEDFIKTAKEHSRELARLIEEVLERKARVRFS
jgi:hypothetical protein